MSSRENTVILYLPTELLMQIRKDASAKEQLSGRFILSVLTEHFKDRLPKEIYERLKDKYSMTESEAKEIKRLEEKEKQKKREIREKRLQDRENRRQAKIKYLLEQKQKWQSNFEATKSENAVRHIQEINEKLLQLGYEEGEKP